MKRLLLLSLALLSSNLSFGAACGSMALNPTTGRLDCVGTSGTTTISTNTAGAGSFIFNTDTLQTGASFYVSKGTVDRNLVVSNSIYTDGAGIASSGYTLSSSPAFQANLPGFGFGFPGAYAFSIFQCPFGTCFDSGAGIRYTDTRRAFPPSDVLYPGLSMGANSVLFPNDPANGSIAITSAGAIRFADSSNTYYVGFKSPDTLPTDFTYTLPSSTGTAKQFLQTDGSNNLSFATGILSQSTLQSGAQFNVSSGTIQNYLTINGNPASDQSAVTRGYIGSRSQNLVTNGSGLLGNNYNFAHDYFGGSGFTFDPVETHGGGGSFRANQAFGIFLTDELMAVDTQKTYRLVTWGKSGEAGGANYNAANVQYVGIIPYDADLLFIEPFYYAKFAGSTDTTLAAQINPGDTTITLTNATGWYNGSANLSINQMSWWPYSNSKGYSYPNYTYTRNTSYYIYSGGYTYATDGLWGTGGISGNVITLTHPWTGPTLPIGTPVRNAESGSTFKYITISGAVPNAWTRYEGYIGGIDVNGQQNLNQFPYGTSYLKPVFLINFHGAADNNIRWSDIWFSELSAANLETASGTQIGVVIPGTQTLGGQKTIQAQSSTDIPLIIQGAASQSGNLQAWSDSSGVALSSITASGAFSIRPRTKAQLSTLVPESSNLIYTCTDCTTDGLVISTGTSAGQFGRSSARTTAIQ